MDHNERPRRTPGENPYQSPEAGPRQDVPIAGPALRVRDYALAILDFAVVVVVGAIAGCMVATTIWPNWPIDDSPGAEAAALANPTWWVRPALTAAAFVAAFAVLGAWHVRNSLRRKGGRVQILRRRT